MDNDIVPSNFLINAIKGIIILSIYWSITYFLYQHTFGDREFKVENLLGTIEFISALFIILCLFSLASKLTSKIIRPSFIGIILTACVAMIPCYYFDKFATKYNISDNTISYVLLAMGVLFNLLLLSKIIRNIRYYVLSKRLIKNKEINDENLDSYIQ